MEVRIKCVECICANTCHLKPSSAGTQSVPQASSAAMEPTLIEVEIRRTDGSPHTYSAVVSMSACHAGGRGSLPGPGTLLGVKTWLSAL